MEQKQLDETDESFFAEEYLDEESLDEIFDELDAKENAISSGKNNPFSSVDLGADSKLKKEGKGKDLKEKKDEKKVLKVATAKTEPRVEKNTFSNVKAEVKAALKEEIVITPVKVAAPPKVEAKPVEKKNEEKGSGETKSEKATKYVETAPRVDPWADAKKERKSEEKKSDKTESNGMFKDASTWKALTGITIILLLFSVFTQGFQFAEKSLVLGGGLTLKDAEVKATSFVNENLLRPPYVAQVVSSAEASGLYRVTLSVAGQTVDSYLTKDGKVFFPQGIDTSLKVKGDSPATTTTTVDSPKAVEPVGAKPAEVKTDKPSEPVVVNTAEPAVASAGTVEVTINAKRWLFSPPQVSVKKGDKVIFNIVPVGLDFTFAIPDLGVQQDVKGATKLTVTATKAGSFDYTCSSCEDWRGMKGTLVVE